MPINKRKEAGREEVRHYRVKTRIGEFLAGFRNGAVVELVLPGAWSSRGKHELLGSQEGAVGRSLLAELKAYLSGKLRRFTVKMAPTGTAWQQRVWGEMRRIPWGEVRTYGELARLSGASGAARAVGAACRSNPVVIITPCHRVVASGGGLGGFGGSACRLEIKRLLLDLESAGRS